MRVCSDWSIPLGARYIDLAAVTGPDNRLVLSKRHRLLLHLFFPNNYSCQSVVHAFNLR